MLYNKQRDQSVLVQSVKLQFLLYHIYAAFHEPVSLFTHEPVSLFTHEPVSLFTHEPVSLFTYQVLGYFKDTLCPRDRKHDRNTYIIPGR